MHFSRRGGLSFKKVQTEEEGPSRSRCSSGRGDLVKAMLCGKEVKIPPTAMAIKQVDRADEAGGV